MNELIRLTDVYGGEVIVNINLVTKIVRDISVTGEPLGSMLVMVNDNDVVVKESVDEIIKLILETRSQSNERLLRHLG